MVIDVDALKRAMVESHMPQLTPPPDPLDPANQSSGDRIGRPRDFDNDKDGDNASLRQTHEGLPVSGYQPQTGANVGMVNHNKQLEEIVLRRFDLMRQQPDVVDQRWLAIARTHIEQGFMAANRAIFQPQRIKLDGEP